VFVLVQIFLSLLYDEFSPDSQVATAATAAATAATAATATSGRWESRVKL
jgi:predicted branched-subunit amino acid permease